MIINFIKRDLNLVGVRPLSQNYFSKYPEDLQESRVKIKPGLITPYYADMPKNFEEIINCEKEIFCKEINDFFHQVLVTDFASPRVIFSTL